MLTILSFWVFAAISVAGMLSISAKVGFDLPIDFFILFKTSTKGVICFKMLPYNSLSPSISVFH